MKSVVVCLLLCCAVLVAAGASRKGNELRFKAWKHHHHKHYVNAAAERHAFANFQLTLQRVSAHADVGDATTLNSLADLSPAEFKARYLGYVPSPEAEADAPVQYEWTAAENEEDDDEDEQRVYAAPDSFDWRVAAPGAVQPVRDQGDCRSCWAVAATESLEAQWYLTTNQSVALSLQQTVSCDTGGDDYGCGGGQMPPAFKYMAGSKGIESEAAYPYTSGKSGNSGACTYNSSAAVAHVNATVPFVYAVPACKGYCGDQNKYEPALKVAVAAGQDGAIHGPPAICVDASYWEDYTGGVYSGKCLGQYPTLNHCVQIVGYNGTAPTPYWIVRNSWGTGWGVQGYIYLPYGKNACGLADEVIFPVAVKPTPASHGRHHRSAPHRW